MMPSLGLGLAIATLAVVALAVPVCAETPLSVVYPPDNHQTTADRIFLIGTAPADGEVLVNGTAIARSPAGHFAPSFPLQLGENVFVLRYQGRELQIRVTRLSLVPTLPPGLGFVADSLTPAVEVARLPGELVCFGAIARNDATVSVRLAGQTIPLAARTSLVQLPPNSAALVGNNQPNLLTGGIPAPARYEGCTSLPAMPGNLGQPEFTLSLNGQTVRQMGTGTIEAIAPNTLVAEVVATNGVARTGASTDYSRLTPLPQGTRAGVTGFEGDWVRLDYGAWIKRAEVAIAPSSIPPRSIIRSIIARQVVRENKDWTEVRFPLETPVPVEIQQTANTLVLTLHNTTAQTDTIAFNDDPAVERLDWQQVAPQKVQYTFQFKSSQQWGYRLRYEGTTLILALRHPPAIDPQRPLQGMHILLDPGHGGDSDLGALGANGYPEKAVNLVVSKLLREELVQRGARVTLTREADVDVPLGDRVAAIEAIAPHIALSIHYNALPDSGDAENTRGVGTFWYHAQAHDLAVFLHNHLVGNLQRESYGVFWNNLALTRPATVPSVLLELGFMTNPTEFEWIVDPQAQQQLAVSLADGIEAWFARQQK